MSFPSQDTSIAGHQGLVNYFSNSIVPQLFVDPEMVLRYFTAPAAAIFTIGQEDMDKSLYSLKDKMAHPALFEIIRGVLLVERSKEKEIRTWDGRVFHMNVQPFFAEQDGPIQGVIVTYLGVTSQARVLKELGELQLQHQYLLRSLSQEQDPGKTLRTVGSSHLEAPIGKGPVAPKTWLRQLKKSFAR